MRPLILLSNDDGYSALGLQTLRAALREAFDVVVCAPRTEQSSMSHSISLHRPLRLIEHEPGLFSVDGTPADCVYVGMMAKGRIVPRRPDLVVSGINHGLNLGNDVFYSGTVAAAREGALRGVSALAASATQDTDLGAAAEWVTRACEVLLAARSEGAALLNVNFPAGAVWPVQATRLGTRSYEDVVHFRTDPRGGEYLWLGGKGVVNCDTPGADTAAHEAGAVSVTPLALKLDEAAGSPLAEQLCRALAV